MSTSTRARATAGRVLRTGGTAAGGRLRTQLVVFCVVGAVSTVVHLGGFALLRPVVDAQAANAVALLVSAVANTWANRRWTFGVRGSEGAARHQLQGLLVLALTLALTAGGLAVLGASVPRASTMLETGVVAVTTALATAMKFAALRWWVFRDPGPAYRSASPEKPGVDSAGPCAGP